MVYLKLGSHKHSEYRFIRFTIEGSCHVSNHFQSDSKRNCWIRCTTVHSLPSAPIFWTKPIGLWQFFHAVQVFEHWEKTPGNAFHERRYPFWKTLCPDTEIIIHCTIIYASLYYGYICPNYNLCSSNISNLPCLIAWWITFLQDCKIWSSTPTAFNTISIFQFFLTRFWYSNNRFGVESFHTVFLLLIILETDRNACSNL